MKNANKNWSTLLPGDVVIAKRPWENCSHEYSPHIVIENDGEFIYALIGSSKEPWLYTRKYFKISNNRNYLLRATNNSYFKLYIYKIPYKDIMYEANWRLTKTDLSILMRKLDSSKYQTANESSKSPILDFKPKKIPFETGDVIKRYDCNSGKNTRFVVITASETKIICINAKIFKMNNGKDEEYQFDFSNLYLIEDINTYVRTDVLYEEEMKNLLLYIKNNKKIINNMINPKIPIGSIVSYGNAFYYVFSLEEFGANMYRIDQEKDYANRIKVQYVPYRINFTKKKFVNYDGFDGKIEEVATPRELLINAEEEKTYQKEKQKEENDFYVRRVFYKVANKKHSDLYLSIRKDETKIVMLNYTKYLNGEIEIKEKSRLTMGKCRSIKPLSLVDLNNIYEDIRQIVMEKFGIELEKIESTISRKKDNINS